MFIVTAIQIRAHSGTKPIKKRSMTAQQHLSKIERCHCHSHFTSESLRSSMHCFRTLRRLIIVRRGANNEHTGGPFGPGTGFCGPGGGFLVLVAVVTCHHFYYHETTPQTTKTSTRNTRTTPGLVTVWFICNFLFCLTS